MIIKNINIDEYINGVKNLVNQKGFKALNGQIIILENDLSIKSIININDDIKDLIKNKEKLYLPFVSGFDSYVKCVNGAEFDLDEGLEPEWIEGVGYIDSATRLIDIGDFTISPKNIAGFTIQKIKDGYQIEIAEYILENNYVKLIDNTGLLGIEIKKFLQK